MKLISFTSGAGTHVGVVDAKKGLIADLTSLSPDTPAFASMLALIDAGECAVGEARNLSDAAMKQGRVVPLETVRLLAPLPNPRQIRDFTSFPTHIRQAPTGMQRIAARRRGDEAAAQSARPQADIPEIYKDRPIYYISNRFSIGGPDEDVIWPDYSELMDFELEFAFVVGRKGRNIPANAAADHIFGYMVYNDFSARDTQFLEMQGMLGPAKGKSFDGGNVFGPWLVTRDEIADAGNLTMQVRVNGETWAKGSSSDMLFTCEDMLSYVSREETIHAGEIFGSGTVGNGCGLEQDRYLQHGDLIELEVEGLGILRNRVLRHKPFDLAAE